MKNNLFIVALFSFYNCFGQNQNNTFLRLDSLADNTIHTGKISNLKLLCDTMLSISKISHDEIMLAKSKVWLGSYYNEIGDFTNSQINLFEALEIFEKLDYSDGICFTQKEIGVFYKYIEHYDEAIKYLEYAKESLPLAMKEKHPMSSNLDNRVYTHLAESVMRKRIFEHDTTTKIDSIKSYIDMAIKSTDKTNPYSVCRTDFVQSISHYQDDPSLSKLFNKDVWILP